VKDDDWSDSEGASFHPMEDDDAGLANRLSARFVGRLVVGMSPAEQSYAEGWPPPRFEVGVTPKGNRVLAVVFMGGRSIADWDGSEAEAELITESCAETKAIDSAWDYWVQGGGWKEWRGGPLPP
jgi:hypothetical protein